MQFRFDNGADIRFVFLAILRVCDDVHCDFDKVWTSVTAMVVSFCILSSSQMMVMSWIASGSEHIVTFIMY